MNALEIKELCKSYDGFSLEHVNLTLPSGCIMGLIGENGAGKSTTIKLILDMIKRDSGSVAILGRDNRDKLTLTKEDLGVVLDEVGVSGSLTGKNIDRIMKNTYRNWDSRVFRDYMKKFSLPDSKKFKDLSRGMKMKMGLAIALSHDPKLLILDEATSGLDPVVRDEVIDIFCNFTRNENHAILISSHIVSDLEKICDYIAFLHKGRILLCQEKDRLYEQYGIIHCDEKTMADIPSSAVIGKKSSGYGVDAIVDRSSAPGGIDVSPIDIEQLFIFMVKEAV